MNKDSKFYVKPTFKERMVKFMDSVKYSILFWKGRSKGIIRTRNLEWSDLRFIFFPSRLDKYGY